MDLRRNSRGICMQAKGDYLDRVHSDQMVLEIVRAGRLSCISCGQRQLKGGHQARQLNDMVLVMARRGGWTA
jgi:phage head maturation protease